MGFVKEKKKGTEIVILLVGRIIQSFISALNAAGNRASE